MNDQDISNNLAFSSEFNYRKILINSNQTVTVPSTASFPNYNTVLTVDTTLTYVPTAEVSYEYLGTMTYGGLAPGPDNFAVWFELVGSTYSLKCGFIGDGNTYSVTIYYRIYIDPEVDNA